MNKTLADYMQEDNLRMYSAIARVRELHKPFVMAPNCTLCDHCWDAEAEDYYEYPCPTIQALEPTKEDLTEFPKFEWQK